MAWTCTGSSNSELVDNLAKKGIFHSDRVATAMKKVDRANYVLHKTAAYQDSPQSIGHDATISAPHMHAHAIENLLSFLEPGARVLDVGSGSGYLSAVLYHVISGNGKVVGVDHIPELVEWSVANMKKDGLGQALEENQIEIITGDGRQGYASEGPYDAIHVGAAAPTVPSPLIEQLACPGRMFIPVGTGHQEILQVDKDTDGNITVKTLMGVSYVPLTDRPKRV